MRYKRVSDKITIRQSRIGAVIFSLLFLIIMIGWPWLALGMPTSLTELQSLDQGFVAEIGLNAGFFVIAGLPLFLLPWLVKNLYIALAGRTIVFDGTAKAILKNKKTLARFSEIRNFNFKNMEGIDIYLDCLLHNGKKIRLGNIGSSQHMDLIKSDILDVVCFSDQTIDEKPRKDSIRTVCRIIHYIVLVVSILMLLGSLYAFCSATLLSLIGTTTTGKIIDTRIESTERMVESGRVGRPKKKVRKISTVYISTVEFRDSEGKRRTFETSAVTGGGNVSVVYFAFWPAFARVKSFSGNWGAVVILLVFGVLTFCIAQMFNEKFFEKVKRWKSQREGKKAAYPDG